ncbi:hypothetical protein AQB9606_00354 [Aquabacterium sp. CECT 9606]|nr:hypothetical protein AQB9606_00354 [Aquabacterium sp. CECT 9606]
MLANAQFARPTSRQCGISICQTYDFETWISKQSRYVAMGTDPPKTYQTDSDFLHFNNL